MKTRISFIFIAAFFLVSASVANADFMQYDSGTYTTPDGWNTITSYSPLSMSHGQWYTVGLNDEVASGSEVRIVFHDLWNGDLEPNFLELWVFDEPASGPAPAEFTLAGWDQTDSTMPDWAGTYNAISLGIWQDFDAGATINDVVFTINDPDLLASLINGNTFTIGIDPDCRFFGSEITVETAVPEPATMFMMGSGLVGLAFLSRKRIAKS